MSLHEATKEATLLRQSFHHFSIDLTQRVVDEMDDSVTCQHISRNDRDVLVQKQMTTRACDGVRVVTGERTQSGSSGAVEI